MYHSTFFLQFWVGNWVVAEEGQNKEIIDYLFRVIGIDFSLNRRKIEGKSDTIWHSCVLLEKSALNKWEDHFDNTSQISSTREKIPHYTVSHQMISMKR